MPCQEGFRRDDRRRLPKDSTPEPPSPWRHVYALIPLSRPSPTLGRARFDVHVGAVVSADVDITAPLDDTVGESAVVLCRHQRSGLRSLPCSLIGRMVRVLQLSQIPTLSQITWTDRPELIFDSIWALPDRTMLTLADTENSPANLRKYHTRATNGEIQCSEYVMYSSASLKIA